MARCSNVNCLRWVRVLPIELLPYKTYSIDVIQLSTKRYLATNKSYRESAASLSQSDGTIIAHTTIYHWITRLGEKILDRSPLPQDCFAPSATAVIAQTDRVLPHKDLQSEFLKATPKISPDKYRSQRRLDQLQAVYKLLIVAALLFDATHNSLQKWNELLLPSFYVAVWAFPSVFSGTHLQRAHPP